MRQLKKCRMAVNLICEGDRANHVVYLHNLGEPLFCRAKLPESADQKQKDIMDAAQTFVHSIQLSQFRAHITPKVHLKSCRDT